MITNDATTLSWERSISHIDLLFIDDDPRFLGRIKGWLAETRYKNLPVEYCDCIDDAVEKYRKISRAKLPVCFVDLTIQNEHDGFELIELLREFRSDASFTVITNDLKIGAGYRAAGGGVNDFRLKRDLRDAQSLERLLLATVDTLVIHERLFLERSISSINASVQSLVHDIETLLQDAHSEIEKLSRKPGYEAITRPMDSISQAREIFDDYRDSLTSINIIDVKDVEKLEIMSLVSDVVEAQRKRKSSHLDPPVISIKYDLDRVSYKIDQKKLRTIARNLLGNAVKFSYDSGVVDVVVRDFYIDDVLFLELSVSDIGCGVAEEYPGQILEYGAKGHNNSGRKGLGIGLWVCDQLARGHSQAGGNGKLDYANRSPEPGATFKILIPQREREPE